MYLGHPGLGLDPEVVGRLIRHSDPGVFLPWPICRRLAARGGHALHENHLAERPWPGVRRVIRLDRNQEPWHVTLRLRSVHLFHRSGIVPDDSAAVRRLPARSVVVGAELLSHAVRQLREWADELPFQHATLALDTPVNLDAPGFHSDQETVPLRDADVRREVGRSRLSGGSRYHDTKNGRRKGRASNHGRAPIPGFKTPPPP